MDNIIFKVKVGSHAYGTNIEGSDEDFKGIYIQDPLDVLNNGYREQVTVNKDEVYYELRRFIELCCTGNPTMLEILYSPEDCIIYKDSIADKLIENRQDFLSKSCKYSFGGYAYSQIAKAKGLNKKMNWEKSKIERKTVLDFCYVLDGKLSIPVKKWLKTNNYSQERCGLATIPHWRFTYNLFYDHLADIKSDNPKYKDIETHKFRGIVTNEETSNDICLSEIPEYCQKETTLSFNKDEYQVHCKEYLQYQTWLAERNVQRYVDIKNHGQQIDGKNLLHCYRLIETGIEIAKHQTINVRRPNADFLISIRKGEHDLEKLLNLATEKINELDKAFQESTLPDKVDRGKFMSLMVRIRNEYYNKI